MKFKEIDLDKIIKNGEMGNNVQIAKNNAHTI